MNTVHLRFIEAIFRAYEREHGTLGMSKGAYREFANEVWMICAEFVRKKSPKIVGRKIPVENTIGLYFHCRLCPQGEISEFLVGYSEVGLQVWCRRHNVNVIHLDFEGRKFHARRGSGVDPE